MNEFAITHAGPVRFAIVGLVFGVLLLAQMMRPRRGEHSSLARRLRNVGLTLIAALIVYLVLPLTAVGFALLVEQRQIGFFHHFDWPFGLELAISVIVLDLAIYWQHRWMHVLPWLWRIHRVHHTDTQFEVTLGLRFHPAEILLSLFYKFAVIAALGAAPISVLCYEILLAVFALFSHADLHIPTTWERRLRWFVITPDWHRVHHSVHRVETDSNYGNLLSLWDRLFRSMVAQPRDGHRSMSIGLDEFREERSQRLAALLVLPILPDRHSSRR